MVVCKEYTEMHGQQNIKIRKTVDPDLNSVKDSRDVSRFYVFYNYCYNILAQLSYIWTMLHFVTILNPSPYFHCALRSHGETLQKNLTRIGMEED